MSDIDTNVNNTEEQPATKKRSFKVLLLNHGQNNGTISYY